MSTAVKQFHEEEAIGKTLDDLKSANAMILGLDTASVERLASGCARQGYVRGRVIYVQGRSAHGRISRDFYKTGQRM